MCDQIKYNFIYSNLRVPLMLGLALLALSSSAVAVESSTRVGSHKYESGNEKIPLQVTHDIKVVYQISDNKLKGNSNRGLTYAKKLLDTYNSAGVVDSEIDLHLVFHGSSIPALINESARGRLQVEGDLVNPNTALINELTERGVSIEICESTMAQHHVTPEDLISTNIAIVVGAFPRIISLQHLGFVYIKFE
ncbi:DsrE family protein [Coraliomargarita sp. W4R53]